jgi:Rps23 Pro-64 3,4-dihydroxylase Tpa1-like proline 4-hydroxylase
MKSSASCINLGGAQVGNVPFPHFSASSVLTDSLETRLYNWLQEYEQWSLTEMDFYTQFEFSLFDVTLPSELAPLLSEETIRVISAFFQEKFDVGPIDMVGATVHKLINGHRIGIHNDYIGPEETHRLIIQLNPHWEDSKGGFLMLFGSDDSQDVSKVVRPINNTAFGFPLSTHSYHAVSTVRDFCRYTLVYTLKEQR